MRQTLLLITIAAGFACAEDRSRPDSGEREDATVDAGLQRDSGADAGQDDAGSDSGVTRDAAVIDGSLAGTSLEGITLEWDQELVRCAHWLNGSDLEKAVAQKVQVNLPPHSRTTLEPGDLATATLTAGSVHRSPFSADQWRIDGSASTLIEWTLTPPADSAHLSAIIAHDLGAAGRLYEVFSVRRQAGDRSPVRYGDPYEVELAYEPPGGEQFSLVPCEGDPELERAVVVLSASSGSDWVTLIREQRTRLVAAGSAPVYPTRAEALFSWQPAWSEAFLAEGHWTQVYTASLHNWNERALIRFDHDLKWSYLVFGPLGRGEMPSYPAVMPQTIELTDVNNPGGQEGSLSLTSIQLPGGTVSTQTFDVEVDWRRIDETHLSRTMIGCPTPEILSLWGISANGTYLFQLGFCQANSPITELDLFVPIYFEPAPHLAGQTFDSSAISQVDVAGSPGVEINLGSYSVQLAEPGVYRTIILDASRAMLDDLNGYETELFQTGAFSGQRETIAGENDDKTVSATLVRQWVAQGAGNSGIYAPVSFELRFAGEMHRVVAWDKLAYTNSHHNWDDTLETDDGELRMFWRVVEFGQAYEVRAERYGDGFEVLPPTVIRR